MNAIAFIVLTAKDHFARNPVSAKYGLSALGPLYEDLSDREIDDLLKETWSRPYVYEPFTQFKERPGGGVYVNVNTSGFRVTTNQGPWPPQSSSFNIFLFGGSTTFGYGVADDQTVASYLQEYLSKKMGRDVRVYNFGRGNYYSTQERILYEHLLTSGFLPALAIFVDGLNDFYYHDNEPLYTNRLRSFVDTGQSATRVLGRFVVSETSLGRAASELRGDFLRRVNGEAEERGESDGYSASLVSDRVIRRYLANKKAIEGVSTAFGVEPIFVWQPVPMYKYDQRYHAFAEGGYGRHGYAQNGYEHMAESVRREPLGGNFLWCADIQSDATEPLYVDKVHYSPKLSRLLAGAMADLWLSAR